MTAIELIFIQYTEEEKKELMINLLDYHQRFSLSKNCLFVKYIDLITHRGYTQDAALELAKKTITKHALKIALYGKQ